MYFSFPLRKVLYMATALVVLVGCMYGSLALKRHLYGDTPFATSLGIIVHEAYDDITLSMRGGGSRIASAIGGLFVAEPAHSAPASGEAAPTAKAIPVLTYHRITGWSWGAANSAARETQDGANVSLDTFTKQMDALARDGWHTVTLAQYEQFMDGTLSLPEKSFLLTFDDGAKESYYPVDPVLKRLGFSAVAYIIVADMIQPESAYYLTQPEIRRMLASGRWEIGSHSFNGHRSYPISETDPDGGRFFSDRLWLTGAHRYETPAEFTERVSNDLAQSQSALATTFKVPVDTLAFPYSDFGVVSRNFPSAADTTLAAAERLYAYAFVQADSSHFSLDYPHDPAFLERRIHVSPSWSGGDLVDILSRAVPKELPYTDTFTRNSGWLPSWGTLAIERGSLSLTATGDRTSASSILDGTPLWDAYEYDAQVDWHDGYAFLLSHVADARTYRACGFSDGSVRLVSVVDGTTQVLGQESDAGIVEGTGHTLGVRTQGSVMSCLYDGRTVLRVDSLRPSTGGIGLQAWNTTPATASLTAHRIDVIQLSP